MPLPHTLNLAIIHLINYSTETWQTKANLNVASHIHSNIL